MGGIVGRSFARCHVGRSGRVATKHDDSVKGGEFPALTKAVREGDVATVSMAL